MQAFCSAEPKPLKPLPTPTPLQVLVCFFQKERKILPNTFFKRKVWQCTYETIRHFHLSHLWRLEHCRDDEDVSYDAAQDDEGVEHGEGEQGGVGHGAGLKGVLRKTTRKGRFNLRTTFIFGPAWGAV